MLSLLMMEAEESSISRRGTGSARLLRQRYDTPSPRSSNVRNRIAQMISRIDVPASGAGSGPLGSGLGEENNCHLLCDKRGEFGERLTCYSAMVWHLASP